jgi:RNA polymerase sigma-70 factor (ECF subfamily)
MSIDQETEQPLSDQELMSLIAQGKTCELGQLYLRHKEKVIALAYRILGQWSLAEDVCQEVFLRIRRAAPNYKPDAEFTTWLYRIVVNLCLDEKRRQKRTAIENSQITELLKITKEHPCGVNQKIETIDAVKKAVKKLNKRQQTVVEMHKIEGLSHTEISKRTGWSQSSIESLLVRAYKKLRIELVVQKDK